MPLTVAEIDELTQFHGISKNIASDWSILRNLFVLSGWASKQVGTTRIPKSLCVAAVFKSDALQALKITGVKGMIAFRISAIQESFSMHWSNIFQIENSVQIATESDRFTRLCRGEDVDSLEIEAGM